MKGRAVAALGLFLVAGALLRPAARAAPAAAAHAGCPPEMVHVAGYCIDRWEASLVDAQSGLPLSPYYPPSPGLLRRVLELWRIERFQVGDAAARSMPLPEVGAHQLDKRFQPKAVSRAGVVPNGYMSYPMAKLACQNAGKRLCTEKEWVLACRGAQNSLFPYGDVFVKNKCNVFRLQHPAYVLHGSSSSGHTDPRLNLVFENGEDPLLRRTGGTPTCASRWGQDAALDMVGNLDEWIDDEAGVFVGGFYARATTKGCDARIADHAPVYYDYSIGTRCCKDSR